MSLFGSHSVQSYSNETHSAPSHVGSRSLRTSFGTPSEPSARKWAFSSGVRIRASVTRERRVGHHACCCNHVHSVWSFGAFWSGDQLVAGHCVRPRSILLQPIIMLAFEGSLNMGHNQTYVLLVGQQLRQTCFGRFREVNLSWTYSSPSEARQNRAKTSPIWGKTSSGQPIAFLPMMKVPLGIPFFIQFTNCSNLSRSLVPCDAERACIQP